MINNDGADIDRIAPDPARHPDIIVSGVAAGERGKWLLRGLTGVVLLTAAIWLALLFG